MGQLAATAFRADPTGFASTADHRVMWENDVGRLWFDPDGTGAAEWSTQWHTGAEALPAEAHATLRLIAAGGPFPYDRDGSVFQNREGRLPSQPRGYYREYTVETPGSPDRGARRIVTGGEPPTEYFYTDDPYRSFRRLEAVTR